MKAKLLITTPPDERWQTKRIDGKLFNIRELESVYHYVENIALGYIEASLEDILEVSAVDPQGWQLSGREARILARQELRGYAPRFIGMAVTKPWNRDQALLLAETLKREDADSVLIACGGDAATCPEEYMKAGVFNYIVTGEPGPTMRRLIDGILKGAAPEVPGVHPTPATRRNPLESRRFPKRHHVGQTNFAHGVRLESIPIIPMYINEGCYAKCGFCAFHAGEPTLLMRSVQSACDELEQVREQFGLGSRFKISASGLNLLTNPKLIGALLDELVSRGYEPVIGGGTRVSDISRSRDLLEKHQQRIGRLGLGFESFDDTFLKKWKKGHAVRDIAQAASFLEKLGIRYDGYMAAVDLETSYDDILRSNRNMFHAGLFPPGFWRHLSFGLGQLMNYTPTPSLMELGAGKRYSDAQLVFEATNRAFFQAGLGSALLVADYMLLRDRIRADPRYHDLEKVMAAHFEFGHLLGTKYMRDFEETIERTKFREGTLELLTGPGRSRMIGQVEKGLMDSYAARKATGSELVAEEEKYLAHLNRGFAQWFENEVRDVILDISAQALAQTASPVERARIHADLAHMLSNTADEKRHWEIAAQLDPTNLYNYEYGYSLIQSGDGGYQEKMQQAFRGAQDLKEIMILPDFGQIIASSLYWIDNDRGLQLAQEASKTHQGSGATSCMTAYHFDILDDPQGALPYALEYTRRSPTRIMGWEYLEKIATRLGNHKIAGEARAFSRSLFRRVPAAE